MRYAILYIDTSIFLHYRSFDEIDWLDIAGSDQVELRIPSVVLRELEKKKIEHPRQKIRERAGKALNKLSRFSEEGLCVSVRECVTVDFETQEPAIDFASHGLDESVNDDVLLASVLASRQREGDNRAVKLVAEDLSLKLKARTNDIETISLPEKYKLPPAPDAAQKKIRRLRRENERLKNSMPRLDLSFQDGGEHTVFTLSANGCQGAGYLAERMEEVRSQFPQRNSGTKKTGPVFRPVPERELKEHNAKRRRYYDEYEEYLRDKRDSSDEMDRTCQLALEVQNEGTSPAEDIEIILSFDNEVLIRTEEDLPSPPSEPEPPPVLHDDPGSPSDGEVEVWDKKNDATYQAIMSRGKGPAGVTGPDIAGTDSHRVKYEVEQIKHSRSQILPAVFVTFESYESAHSFGFDYRIHATNLPEESTGKLNVRVEKEEE